MSKKVRFAMFIAVSFVPLLVFSLILDFITWVLKILIEHYINLVASWNNVYKAK